MLVHRAVKFDCFNVKREKDVYSAISSNLRCSFFLFSDNRTVAIFANCSLAEFLFQMREFIAHYCNAPGRESGESVSRNGRAVSPREERKSACGK